MFLVSLWNHYLSAEETSMAIVKDKQMLFSSVIFMLIYYYGCKIYWIL